MVNPSYFKNPKQGMAFTALAEPFSNFIFAFVVLLICYPLFGSNIVSGSAMDYLTDFLWVLFSINIVLGIFNLIPIPPLDGSKVFAILLPESAYFRFINFKYGFIVLIVLIYTGLTSNIIEPFMTVMYRGYFSIIERIYSFL